jgi:amidase
MKKKLVHAFGKDVLADHDAVGIAALIKNKDISPAEAAEAAISRVEKVNNILNAVAVKDYEAAESRTVSSMPGLFSGVPSFIKDNVDVKGLAGRHGSLAVQGHPAKKNGRFAEQYLSLGFNILGKTALPEFGFNCTTEYMGQPPVRNPWHTDYSTGGSSGGSAALVAAGAVPIAHANDGGGSIRIPASCCGLVGLKSTMGRLVDGELARMLPVNIVSEGVLTRTVRDTAHFFAGAELYMKNRRLPSIGLVEGPSQRRLKIGLIMDSITGYATCPATRAVVQKTADLLSGLGHHVEEMPIPVSPSFADDFSDYWAFLAYMVTRFGKITFGKDFDSEKVDGLTKGLADRFRKRMKRLPVVLYRLKRTRNQYSDIMKNYDLILSPVLAHAVPELGYLSPEQPYDILFERMMNYVSFTPLNNANGSPAISLPAGASANGVPIGIQLSASHGDERTLLEIAYEIEAASPWRRITGK